MAKVMPMLRVGIIASLVGTIGGIVTGIGLILMKKRSITLLKIILGLIILQAVLEIMNQNYGEVSYLSIIIYGVITHYFNRFKDHFS